MADAVDPAEALEAAFDGLPERAVEALVSMGSRLEFSAGDPVISEGGHADALHVVLSGRVRLSVHHRHADLAVATLGPGDLLGWSWLVAPHRWDFDATAVVPTEMLRIPAVELHEMMHDDTAVAAAMAKGMLAVLSRRLRDTRIQVLDQFAADSGGATP